MPCLLRARTAKAPGVITFTHNEVLNGVIGKSSKIQNLLTDKALKEEWMFGVHVQGDCTWLKSWPTKSWESFYLWPDKNASFLSNVDKNKIYPLTCINFLPQSFEMNAVEKKWDICIVSRPTELKKIHESLILVKKMLEKKSDLRIVFIVPDSRKIKLGLGAYKKQQIDKRYFELPLKYFSSKELSNISFISSSQEAFGKFPLSADLVFDIISHSKLLMLNSHQEGVPRVIAEALLGSTVCVVSEKLKSGLNFMLNESNSIKLGDDLDQSATRLLETISKYSSFDFDMKLNRQFFLENYNLDNFKKTILSKNELNDDDQLGWQLHSLNNRLACHGEKIFYQILNNEDLFIDWFKKADEFKAKIVDEEYFFGPELIFNDEPSLRQKYNIQFFKTMIKSIIKGFL